MTCNLGCDLDMTFECEIDFHSRNIVQHDVDKTGNSVVTDSPIHLKIVAVNVIPSPGTVLSWPFNLRNKIKPKLQLKIQSR